MTQEEELQIIRTAIVNLREHFDAVQIFASKLDDEDGGTCSLNLGDGNWFARVGQVQIWMDKNRERARVEVRNEEG